MIGVCAWAAALVILTAQAAEQRPQPPPLRPGSAEVHGRVVDAVSEQPVSDLEVRLTEMDTADDTTFTPPQRRRTAVTRTDARGAFSFTKVGSGSYGIIVTGKAHLPACFGSARGSFGPCAPITLTDDQARRDAEIFVSPGAIVRGRVIDHEGRAVSRAGVRLAMPGRNQTIAGAALSDGDGRFEIGGLQPGQVTLTVEIPGRNGEGLIRAYYPGVTKEQDAQPIAVDIDDPIDVEMRLPRLVIGSINARVTGPDGFQLDTYFLRQPETNLRISLSTVDDGANRILYLREGRYVIEARGVANGKPLAAFPTIDVGDGETDLSIQLEEAGAIAGRVIAERGGVPPLNGAQITATWILDGNEIEPASTDVVSVAPDGGFSFDRLFGARNFKVTGLDAGWRVVSIRAERTDITGSAFDIVPGSRTQLIVTVGRQ